MREIKNCLNCKYEPEWGNWSGIDYPRSVGECKWNNQLPPLPAVYVIQRNWVTKFKDGSGVKTNCKTWEPKSCEK